MGESARDRPGVPFVCLFVCLIFLFFKKKVFCKRFILVPAVLDRHVLAVAVNVPKEYWWSVGFEEGLRMFSKGFLLDSSSVGGVKTFPLLSVLCMCSLSWFLLKMIWLLATRQSVDRRTWTVIVLFVGAFVLFCGRSAFGKFVNLMPFSRSLVPFSEFFLHFQMAAVILIGWFFGEVSSNFFSFFF